MNFLTIVSFIKKYKGAFSALAGVVALAFTLTQLHDWVYNKGYNDAVIKVKAEQQEIQTRLIKQAEERMLQILNQQKIFYEEELANVKAEVIIKTEVKEVIKYVDREIEVSADCADLAYDVVSVLRDATGIVTKRGNGGESTESRDPSSITRTLQ